MCGANCLMISGRTWMVTIVVLADAPDRTRSCRSSEVNMTPNAMPSGASSDTTPVDGARSNLLRRLARTGPDILADYERGKIANPRGAAKAAGIRLSDVVRLGNPATVSASRTNAASHLDRCDAEPHVAPGCSWRQISNHWSAALICQPPSPGCQSPRYAMRLGLLRLSSVRPMARGRSWWQRQRSSRSVLCTVSASGSAGERA